jgi:hypothetical protein
MSGSLLDEARQNSLIIGRRGLPILRNSVSAIGRSCCGAHAPNLLSTGRRYGG